MSFSSGVKEELEKHVSAARHCQLAEFTSIFHCCGQIERRQNGEKWSIRLKIQTENPSVARKCFTLLKKTFNIDTDIVENVSDRQDRISSYTLLIEGEAQVLRLLQAMKLLDADGSLWQESGRVNSLLVKNTCCQRAFLRGAYLAIGSMSTPQKCYHLEFVCTNRIQAEQIRDMILGFNVEAKIVKRKKYYVVYLKEGAGIVDLLNIMEAHVALMEFENLRILKEMRNSINRRVNCEAANITKTVNAATKQIDDIMLIRDTYGLKHLPDNLRQMAEVRLEYPDATLKELGEYLTPQVGKSGVNHRLRKLSELADEMREQGVRRRNYD